MRLQLALLLGGVLLALGVTFFVTTRKRGPSTHDLGPISDRWIADHRSHPDESL